MEPQTQVVGGVRPRRPRRGWRPPGALGAGPSRVSREPPAASELRRRPGSSLPVPGLTSCRVLGAPVGWRLPRGFQPLCAPKGGGQRPAMWMGPPAGRSPEAMVLSPAPLPPGWPLGLGSDVPERPRAIRLHLVAPRPQGLTSPDSRGLCLSLGPLGAGRQAGAQAGGGQEAPAEGLRAPAG